MEKEFDVVALGELLIDFTENGLSNQGNPILEANPGGAPCNVLSMLQKLGKKTAFIGKVGEDAFGKYLAKEITQEGISAVGLHYDNEVHTTLAFVSNQENGERDFSFYRNPGADICLKEEEVDETIIKNSKIFHYGSLSFTDEPSRSASKKAIQIAEEEGILLSYDPNLREPLWDNLEHAKEQIHYGLQHCQILKISDNEILWFTGEDTYEEAVRVLKETYPNIELLCLTLGAEGSQAYYNDLFVEVPAFLTDRTIDATGAGDAFCGCVLNYVLEHGLSFSSEEELKEMLEFAGKASSIVTTKKGALKSMPTLKEIETF